MTSPNMYEVQQAGKIFKAEMAKQANAIAAGDMSIDTAINICAVRVWSAGRQHETERQPKGFIRKLFCRK